MSLRYLKRCLGMYWHVFSWKILYFINHYLLKTYPLIEDCARCDDCGRNVHDFLVPTELWIEVWGNEGGILCYDCFCNRADEKFRQKWRMEISTETNLRTLGTTIPEWTNLTTGEKRKFKRKKNAVNVLEWMKRERWRKRAQKLRN